MLSKGGNIYALNNFDETPIDFAKPLLLKKIEDFCGIEITSHALKQ